MVLGHVAGDVVQVEDVLLEGVAERAAVALLGPGQGLLGLVLQKALEGLALAPLLVGLGKLLGVDPRFQGLGIVALGSDGVPGRHELGAAEQLLGGLAAGLDLADQGGGAVQGRGRVVVGRVGGEVLRVFEIVLELILRRAAVAGGHGPLHGVGVLLDPGAEDGVLGQIRMLVQLGAVQLHPEGASLVPLRAHGPAGPEDLGVGGDGLLRGGVQVLQLLLLGVDALLRRGHGPHRHVRGELVQVQDVFLEGFLRGAAVARRQEPDHLRVGLLGDKIIEGIAQDQVVPFFLPILGLRPDLQGPLLAALAVGRGTGREDRGVELPLFRVGEGVEAGTLEGLLIGLNGFEHALRVIFDLSHRHNLFPFLYAGTGFTAAPGLGPFRGRPGRIPAAACRRSAFSGRIWVFRVR